jgi:AraC family transcriptional activator of mtrCDE
MAPIVEARQSSPLAVPTTRTSSAAKDKVANRPDLRSSRSDLEILMAMLEVDLIALTECLVSPNWRLSFPAAETAGIHYNLAGVGQMSIGNGPTIPLTPHTLVVTPPRQPFRIDAATGHGAVPMTRVVDAQWQSGAVSGTVRRLSATNGEPEVIMISGYFRASYSLSVDLFAALGSPIVERFGAADQLGHKLKAALAELTVQEVGMKAMATALLKQVLVTVLRRSLTSTDLWLERFSVLSDPQVARAFTQMVARPGAPHSVMTLSQTAGLSRSVFMVRFASAFGCSPMAALHQLRMRQAANLLTANILSIQQIAYTVGYAGARSFLRAFRRAYGKSATDYRAAATQASVQQH